MNLIQGFSRNYTSTVMQFSEKCGFYNNLDQIAAKSLKYSEQRY